MLKIKDASGKLVGVLKDEDSAPTMSVEPAGAIANPEEEVVEETTEGETEDGDSNDGNV